MNTLRRKQKDWPQIDLFRFATHIIRLNFHQGIHSYNEQTFAHQMLVCRRVSRLVSFGQKNERHNLNWRLFKSKFRENTCGGKTKLYKPRDLHFAVCFFVSFYFVFHPICRAYQQQEICAHYSNPKKKCRYSFLNFLFCNFVFSVLFCLSVF